jgi:hypothetical protein
MKLSARGGQAEALNNNAMGEPIVIYFTGIITSFRLKNHNSKGELYRAKIGSALGNKFLLL